MDLREQFKKENDFDVYAYRQEYSGARVEKDGFNDEYVEWLESKVKNLSLCAVSHRMEQLKAYNIYLSNRICDSDELGFDDCLEHYLSL